jgi:thioredoxin reductase
VFCNVTQAAIIGAGPYGLSIAAHLRAHGVPFRIFGTPLDTWRRHMPAGMLLKSDPFASNLSHPGGEGTLAAYCKDHGIPYHHTDIPVSLELFNAYALDFQQRFVPDLEDRQVVSLKKSDVSFTLTIDDGEVVPAQFVVCAVGITHFSRVPDELTHLSAELYSHCSAIHDVSAFAGQEVTVLGGGSSAVDTATLLHEAGAKTTLVSRRGALRFANRSPGPRSLYARMRHPSSGLGPGMRSWVCENMPNLFRYLPGNARLEIVRRHLGPSSAGPMKARLEAGAMLLLGEHLERAAEDDGRVRLSLRHDDGTRQDILTDHIIAATGYVPDTRRLTFMSDDLRAAVRTHAWMPMLSRGFESSVTGLYFAGPPAVNTFGPLMRFMVGSEYAAPVVARSIARKARRTESVRTAAPA